MMTEFPDTRASLIAQVKDPKNAEAWERFASLYHPVIYRLARQRGMQDADAQDLAQHVLISVARAIPEWEAHDKTTRFRHWLRRVARNAIINALTRRPLDAGSGATTVQHLLMEHFCSEETDRLINLEYRRELYRKAAGTVQLEVNPETWRAFQMSVVDGRAIERVAEELGKSVGSVYAARSRVMSRLRKTTLMLEDEE